MTESQLTELAAQYGYILVPEHPSGNLSLEGVAHVLATPRLAFSPFGFAKLAPEHRGSYALIVDDVEKMEQAAALLLAQARALSA